MRRYFNRIHTVREVAMSVTNKDSVSVGMCARLLRKLKRLCSRLASHTIDYLYRRRTLLSCVSGLAS